MVLEVMQPGVSAVERKRHNDHRSVNDQLSRRLSFAKGPTYLCRCQLDIEIRIFASAATGSRQDQQVDRDSDTSQEWSLYSSGMWCVYGKIHQGESLTYEGSGHMTNSRVMTFLDSWKSRFVRPDDRRSSQGERVFLYCNA